MILKKAPEREVNNYENYLRRRGFNVPEYYGSYNDGKDLWIVLESIEGSDFRDLSCWEDRLFDCVVSSGNSLAYVSNEDVLKTLEQMDAHVKQGGFLCFDSRNWEMIQRENQRFYFYNPMFKDGNRINLIQVWDHNSDGSITFNLIYISFSSPIFILPQYQSQGIGYKAI